MNDIVINKIQSIQRCIERAREEYRKNPEGFDEDYSRQDAAVLNILRACEQALDLANHIIKAHKMGIPTFSAESFDLLRKKSVIDDDLTEKLKKMVHFRNVVIHQYQRMDIEIVKSVIKSDLDNLVSFTERIMEFGYGHTS
ncbi:MAG: type VII toxin-antitoxin system HepT family RNase toxin [Thermodesulfobacteriota bacterium]